MNVVRRFAVGFFAGALLLSASSTFGNEDAELYEKLKSLMDQRLEFWRGLPYDAPRDDDISDDICPLVSPTNLDPLLKSGRYDMTYAPLPNGDIGVPDNSQRWQILGDVHGFSREVLTIYLGADFCLVLYNLLN